MTFCEMVYGASAVVFVGRSVLLVKRGEPPAAGYWSFPGGHVRAGENAEAAARREVYEETGLEVEITGYVEERDIRSNETGEHGHVYRLSVFAGRVPPGSTPRAASDAAEARFVPFDDLGNYLLTSGADDVIRSAWNVVHGEAL